MGTRLIIYAGIIAVSLLFYTAARYYKMELQTPEMLVSMWWSYAKSYITGHWVESILLPFVTTVAARRVKRRWLSGVIALILALLFFTASYYTVSGVQNILPYEEEILAELKSTPILDYQISDIYNFQSRVNDGYVEKEASSQSGNGSNKDRPAELDMDVNALDVNQLLKCIEYLFASDECKPYVTRAYGLYQSGYVTDHHDAGTILFYHGYFYDDSSFLRGADEFEAAESYGNAVLCLWNYCRFEKGVFMELTERIVDDSLLAVNHDQAHAPLDYCQDIAIDWYLHGSNSWPEDFDRICNAVPDEAFISIVTASVHLAKGDKRAVDSERIEYLLGLEKYRSCPKALILSQLYGHEHLNDLYQLYMNHPDWFETEDLNNLSWMLYERGEYEIAISISRSEYAYTNPTDDVLIRMEAFLQNPDNESDLDSLYVEVTKAIDSGAGEREPRLRLAQIIIGNRLGLEVSYEGLSDVCEEVFWTDSPTGMFIVSSLKNVDGRYEEAYLLTNSILEEIEAPNQLYYRTLFLRAEALMGMASIPEYKDRSMEFYDQAAQLLEGVKDSLEGDYVDCLKLLRDVYKAMGQDDKMSETQELLARITGGEE